MSNRAASTTRWSELTSYSPHNQLPQKEYRTVLLVGKTGSGKSTVGNVLAGTHNKSPPTEVFKEGDSGLSETRSTQTYIVSIGGTTYRIVDTIGIGDTHVSEHVWPVELMRTCKALVFNQVFFITSQRFTEEERKAYNIFRKTLFENIADDFVTIIRTRAEGFMFPKWCAEDIKRTKDSCDEARRIYESAGAIIHVNNPSRWEHEADWVELYREEGRERMLARLDCCNKLYPPLRFHALDEARDCLNYTGGVGRETSVIPIVDFIRMHFRMIYIVLLCLYLPIGYLNFLEDKRTRPVRMANVIESSLKEQNQRERREDSKNE